MIARPDWLRRKYIFSAAVMAVCLTLLLSMGQESGTQVMRRVPVSTAAPGTMRVVVARDPWRPLDAPLTVRTVSSPWSH